MVLLAAFPLSLRIHFAALTPVSADKASLYGLSIGRVSAFQIPAGFGQWKAQAGDGKDLEVFTLLPHCLLGQGWSVALPTAAALSGRFLALSRKWVIELPVGCTLK